MYIYLYIPWIHVCVIKPVGCGTIQKYIKYTKLQFKMLQKFKRTVIPSMSTHKKLIYRIIVCVCRYFLKATLNFSCHY